jgi:hypothetical protein
MSGLENILDYESFDTLNEMVDGYKQGGMVLLFGKKLENGGRRLFASSIKTVLDSPRMRMGGDPGSSAKMVILYDDTYRIEMDSTGKFTSYKISDRDRAIGTLGNKVALNKNKTPYHWISTNYQSIGSLISGMGNILKSIPDIRWEK